MTEPDDLLPTTDSAGSAGGAPDGAGPSAEVTISAPSGSSPLPFQDLRIPTPTPAAPPLTARILAFAAILVGGLLGGLIGYGTADLMSGATLWIMVGLMLGALAGAIGVGVVAGLTLRAMNEWQATAHPEAGPRTGRRTHRLRAGTVTGSPGGAGPKGDPAPGSGTGTGA